MCPRRANPAQQLLARQLQLPERAHNTALRASHTLAARRRECRQSEKAEPAISALRTHHQSTDRRADQHIPHQKTRDRPEKDRKADPQQREQQHRQPSRIPSPQHPGEPIHEQDRNHCADHKDRHHADHDHPLNPPLRCLDPPLTFIIRKLIEFRERAIDLAQRHESHGSLPPACSLPDIAAFVLLEQLHELVAQKLGQPLASAARRRRLAKHEYHRPASLEPAPRRGRRRRTRRIRRNHHNPRPARHTLNPIYDITTIITAVRRFLRKQRIQRFSRITRHLPVKQNNRAERPARTGVHRRAQPRIRRQHRTTRPITSDHRQRRLSRPHHTLAQPRTLSTGRSLLTIRRYTHNHHRPDIARKHRRTKRRINTPDRRGPIRRPRITNKQILPRQHIHHGQPIFRRNTLRTRAELHTRRRPNSQIHRPTANTGDPDSAHGPDRVTGHHTRHPVHTTTRLVLHRALFRARRRHVLPRVGRRALRTTTQLRRFRPRRAAINRVPQPHHHRDRRQHPQHHQHTLPVHATPYAENPAQAEPAGIHRTFRLAYFFEIADEYNSPTRPQFTTFHHAET